MRDYKALMGFNPLHNRPKCDQMILKPESKTGNGKFVIATFGFQTGVESLSDCPTEGRIM